MVSTMQQATDAAGTRRGSVLEYLVLSRLERSATGLADPRVRALPACRNLARRAAATSFRDFVRVGLGVEAGALLRDAAPRGEAAGRSQAGPSGATG